MFGNVLKRAAIAAFLVLVIASLGCTTRHPPYAEAVDRAIVHGGSSWERDDACDALGYLEAPVRLALTGISVNDDCPEYKPDYPGHCHVDTRKICARRGWVQDHLVWHEAGHALFFSKSRDEWVRAAVSIGCYGDTEGEFPRNGILTSYGATNQYEDFAEWVEWAMCYLYHTPTGSTNVDLSRVDASDPRYLAHLELLRDWGAINEAQYKQLEPLFTVRLGGAPMK